jgi:hypothetical protein
MSKLMEKAVAKRFQYDIVKETNSSPPTNSGAELTPHA